MSPMKRSPVKFRGTVSSPFFMKAMVIVAYGLNKLCDSPVVESKPDGTSSDMTLDSPRRYEKTVSEVGSSLL